MKQFLVKHREGLLVALLGLVIIVALNVMMLQYHYQPWTNPKVGFWSAFWNRFEISGFDPYTYIVVSKWRTIYVLSSRLSPQQKITLSPASRARSTLVFNISLLSL